MYILQPIATEQTLIVIARTSQTTGISIYLTNENTNDTDIITPTATYSNGFTSLSAVYTLVESTFYNFRVVVSGANIYRGRVFCTSQTDYEKFSVNQSVYTEETSFNNEYIVL
jgi:hypothetical protein